MITKTVDGRLHMRCISLRQPYLHFIFDLPPENRKDVENRTRPITSEMGPFLMAASAPNRSRSDEQRYFDEACAGALARGVPESLLPRLGDLEHGVLYGCVMFVRKLPSTGLEDSVWKWKFQGHTGYVLSGATRLPSRPVKGQQGIYQVPLTDDDRGILRSAKLL